MSPDSVRFHIYFVFFNHLCPPPLHASYTDQAAPEYGEGENEMQGLSSFYR